MLFFLIGLIWKFVRVSAPFFLLGTRAEVSPFVNTGQAQSNMALCRERGLEHCSVFEYLPGVYETLGAIPSPKESEVVG